MADKVSYRIVEPGEDTPYNVGDSIPYDVNYKKFLFGNPFTEYTSLGYRYPLNPDGTRSKVGIPVKSFDYRDYGPNGGYETYISESLWGPVDDPEYYEKRTKTLKDNLQDDNRNWFERHFPATRNLIQKIKSLENGGLMNYSQYLQQGGGIQDQVAALVQAAMGGDQQATDQINQIMQAAQQGDLKAQQLAQLIRQIAQQLQGQTEEEETAEAYKKGGKVKKCACGSKTPKKEYGGEFNGTLFQKSKLKKGGCPCQLKKVGGKLVEVDGCTGLPVSKHQEGGQVKKYQQPAGPISTPNPQQKLIGPEGSYGPGWSSAYQPTNQWGIPMPKSTKNGVFLSNGTRLLLNQNTGNYQVPGRSWELYALGNDGNYYSNFGVTGSKWDPDTQQWNASGYTYGKDAAGNISFTRNPIEAGDEASPSIAPSLPSTPTPVVAANPNVSVVDYFNSIGQDSSYSNRAKMANELGISNYTGSASQNAQLIQLMKDRQSAKPSNSASILGTLDYLFKNPDTATGVNFMGRFNAPTYAEYLKTAPSINDPNKNSLNENIAANAINRELLAMNLTESGAYRTRNRLDAFKNLNKMYSGEFDFLNADYRTLKGMSRELKRARRRDFVGDTALERSNFYTGKPTE